MLDPGTQPIPGYRLTRRLGAGAFGAVWEAQDAQGNLSALKFVSCRERTEVGSEVRVLRELSQLRHPNIIQLHGIHATSHHIVLSMERADGNLEDLHQTYLEETGKNIPADHLLDLLEQAADALDFLATLTLPNVNPSSRGLQHCDVKPSNLLLLGDTLKVADFGLCAGTSWKTHRNGWRGTPPYAAPELFNGHATAGTDQYALCITFLRLCSGDRAFWNDASSDAPPSGFPIDLTKVRERELPIITRALHPHAGSRWPTCRAFVQALRDASQSNRPQSGFRVRPRPCLRKSGSSSALVAPPLVS
jgi:serine/threonine protein kinase